MRRFLQMLLLSVLGVVTSNAQIFMYASLDSTGTLSGSTGKGTFVGTLSSDLKTLTYQITVARLGNSLGSAHIHVLPTGAIVQPLTFSGNTATGTWTNINDTLVKYLVTEGAYVNIHAPNGAVLITGIIRGGALGFKVHLDGATAGTTSPAKGTGWVRVDSFFKRIQYHVTVAGLTGPGGLNASHFHASPGGAIVRPVTFTDSTATGTWSGFADSIYSLLLKGNIYLNLHNTGGAVEIRGDVKRIGEVGFAASIDGAQASTASTAKGTVWAVLDTGYSKIRYSVTYNRLQGTFNGAHFHNGAGAVRHTITIAGNTANAEWTGFTDADIQDLMKGVAYANIHSLPSFAGGEIRGTLKPTDGLFTAKLDGAQAGTASGGKGTAWLDLTGDTAKYSVTVTGMSGSIFASHFHIAPSGVILQGITISDSNATGSWYLSDDNVANVVKSKVYINMHNPGGGVEIRGNIGLGSQAVTSVAQISNELPSSFELMQNYPNPFNPSTSINFSVNRTAHISLKVFNLLGQDVITLVDEVKSPGTYKVTFDARSLTTGIYFYKLTANNFAETRKMVLLK